MAPHIFIGMIIFFRPWKPNRPSLAVHWVPLSRFWKLRFGNFRSSLKNCKSLLVHYACIIPDVHCVEVPWDRHYMDGTSQVQEGLLDFSLREGNDVPVNIPVSQAYANFLALFSVILSLDCSHGFRSLELAINTNYSAVRWFEMFRIHNLISYSEPCFSPSPSFHSHLLPIYLA